MQVRTLIFRKQIQPNSQQKESGWLVMGRLDELEVSTSETMALADIKVNNDRIYQENSEICYHYSIYLIDHEDSEQTDGESEDSLLWNNSLEFLSVTRIHFPTTTNLDHQFHALKKHFADLPHDEISWRVYGTTELSDQVLVSRCRSFQKLAIWSLSATSYAQVGKAYTYFCIPHKMLDVAPDEWKTKGDCIEYLSMRFAVRDYASAHENLVEIRKELGEKHITLPYRVSGNEDAILCGENIPVENMVALYRAWYQDGLQVLNTFPDIISRIGTRSFIPDYNSPSLDSLTDICRKLLKNIEQCPYIKDNCERDWRRPLIEMSNALVHMSSSATLDESVYLILPGLYAFWENIEKGNLENKDESLYLKFVELCVHTMEHLMRAEGQLSQYPEVRPITYDIPVFALELATAFLQQLNKMLTMPDAEQKRKTNILLVPSAETDVSTVELFPADEDVRGLLQITVPFSMLYDPRLLFLSLCHELAHYVGERCRMRGERYQSYSRGLAGELLFDFFPDCSSESRHLHEFLDERLREMAEKEKDHLANRPLVEIAAAMDAAVKKLEATELFTKLVRDFLSKKQTKTCFKYPNESERAAGTEKFRLRNSDLRILFRETFADLCMLYILKPPPEDYVEMVLKYESNINESTCLRILLSLCTAGNKSKEVFEYVKTVLLRKLGDNFESKKQIDRILKWFHQLDDLTHCPKGFNPEIQLKEYINSCWAELCQVCPLPSNPEDEVDTAGAIYRQIIKPKEDFNYHMILQEIDRSRQAILQDLT